MASEIRQLLERCEAELAFDKEGKEVEEQFIRRPKRPLVNVVFPGRFENAFSVIKNKVDSFWLFGHNQEKVVGFIQVDGQTKLGEELRNVLIPLKTSPSIPERGTVHLAYYLDILSDDYDKQLKTVLDSIKDQDADSSFIGTAYRILYFICDDFDFVNQKKIRERVLAVEKETSSLNNVFRFYLGNQFADGSAIGTEKAYENYNVAALISVLSTTNPDETNEPGNIIGELSQSNYKSFTAAYFSMDKPLSTIARITLKGIVDKRIEAAASNKKDLVEGRAHESDALFFKNAKMEKRRIPSLEEAFNSNIVPNYLPNEKAFSYLPKWRCAKRKGNFDKANKKTLYFLDAFVKKYFTDYTSSIDETILNKAADDFIQTITENYDYDFARNYFESCLNYLTDIEPLKETGIIKRANSIAKVSFYKLMIPRLKEKMKEYAGLSSSYAKKLSELSNALSDVPMPVVPGVQSPDVFYANKTAGYLSGSGVELVSSLKPIAADSLYESGLIECYRKIINKDKDFYHASLEDELRERTMEGAEGASTIANELNSASIRKQSRIKATGIYDVDAYYTFFGKASFASSLDGSAKKVKTCCPDNAEKLVIQSFNPASLL